MSTRKRTRPSLNAADDEDELSPSKNNPGKQTPLSAVKRRKLNTHSSSPSTPKAKSVLRKIGGWIGFAGREQENINGLEEKDELGDEEEETDDLDKDGEEIDDIWEVPDEEEVDRIAAHAIRRRRQSSNTGRAIYTDNKRVAKARGSSKADDIWEVNVSDLEKGSRENTGGKGNVERATPVSNFTSKQKNSPEGESPRRSAGQARKEAQIITTSLPKRSVGRPRKADILKKAKALSREAVRKRMISQEQNEADEEEPEVSGTPKRRTSKAKNTIVADTGVDDDEPYPGHEAGVISSRRARGRPRTENLESFKEAPSGILTPSNNRTRKSSKNVAFEGHDEIDLGFKDIPDSTNRRPTSKKCLVSSERPGKNPESSPKSKRKSGQFKEASQPDEYVDSDGTDDEACVICSGLDSEEPNEILFCDSCDLAVHQLCYNLPVIPIGDWFCRDCYPSANEDAGACGLDLVDVGIGEASNILPDIEGFDGHLRNVQRILLDKLTGQKRIKLRGHDGEMQKVYQVVEQTVLAGEGNSILVMGARGCGKTTLVESVISDLSIDHRESFHVVRLNGFIHTDDKQALREIWRQLGREMEVEDDRGGKANHADTLASLLALLSHPSEISEGGADETARSVIFVLDEFDLFTTHPRQTLLYNLFDIAQGRKAPIVVLGLTTRIDVVESLEKRVKSRFSHRYVHLSLPCNPIAFWEICKEGLTIDAKELSTAGFNVRIAGQGEFLSFWNSMVDDLYNNDVAFKHRIQSHFYRSKSVPAFFTSCILRIANLCPKNLPLTCLEFTSDSSALSAPDSKLHILQGLSELELVLLIAAARLDIILDTDTCNFTMAYDEYSSLTSRHKIQTSSTGVTALGASAKVWSKDIALEAWERLAEYDLLVPAGIGVGSARDFGAGGRMWKADVGLEEITGSVENLSGVMVRWCREI